MKPIAGGSIVLVLVLTAVSVHLLGADGSGTRGSAARTDFVVSDSRDAGPGTLRDAILASDRLTSHVRILVKARQIALESALPALINPRGVEIDAEPAAGIIDANRQASGATLSITSPGSILRGIHFTRSHGSAILINAEGVQLDTIVISDSKVGVLLSSNARGSEIRNSIFERNETALTADPDIGNVTVSSSIFRSNTRAGFWLVAPADPGQRKLAAGDASVSARIIDCVFEKNAAGIVVGNRPVSVQKSRFFDNQDSALTILGGIVRVEDNEIRGNTSTAITINAGTGVALIHNSFLNNRAAAIMTRDSDVSIDRNTLKHNGLGIVAVTSDAALVPVIRDNLITQTGADAITLIGGTAIVQRNQILDNRGAGMRALDIVREGIRVKAVLQLQDNVVKGNASDAPVTGIYAVGGAS
jgi:hypothetical protein